MTDNKECQQVTTGSKRNEEKVRRIKAMEARSFGILGLICGHEGCKAFREFDDVGMTPGYSLASDIEDGKDIYDRLLDEAYMVLGGLDDYLRKMKNVANTLDTFKEYCKGHEREFEVNGEIHDVATLLESTALLCEEALQERETQEEEWVKAHEKKEPHPVFAPILDTIKGANHA